MIPRAYTWLPVRLLKEAKHSRITCNDSGPTKRSCLSVATRTQTAELHSYASRKKKSRPQDAYAVRQAAANRAAALTRVEEIRAKKLEELGDSIRGAKEDTAFVRSFDSAIDSLRAFPSLGISDTQGTKSGTTVDESHISPTRTHVTGFDYLNHFLTPEEIASSLEVSKELTAPYIASDRYGADTDAEMKAKTRQDGDFNRSAVAIARIAAVENASSRQRTLINTRRCIGEFGRHSTDGSLRLRLNRDGEQVRKERVGPDTGSSEVQIAILTAKIRVLAMEFEGRSRNDKVNKRNLRLLLHRRQKLLKYLQKQDRGGDRWQHLVKKLGLTPATWLGEINVR